MIRAAEQAVGADRPLASVLKIKNSGGRSTAALDSYFYVSVMTNRLKVAVALGAVSVGVLLAARSVVRNPSPIEKAAPALAIRQTSSHPDGWTKIEVEKTFSFYLPPDVKEEEPIGNIDYFGPQKSFGDKTLNASYMYVEKWRNEELRGKVSCDLLMKGLAAEPGFRSSEVAIANLRARQVSGEFDKPKMVQSTLCFPDTGDGTVLIFTTSHKGDRAVDAEKIIDSIEFP
jgi:hypothetical protein